MYDWTEDTTRKPGTRQTLTINGRDYGFCWIPSGEFMMGSPDAGTAWSADIPEPLHRATLTRGFWMQETPVSQRLYRNFMQGTYISDSKNFDSDDYPICGVGYSKALLFCQRLTQTLPANLQADLPTETQWEYACDAGAGTIFNFGDEVDYTKGCFANWNAPQNVPTEPCRMGSFAPNNWGLYDMHGLVFERCKDLIGEYTDAPVVDPQGLDVEDWRAAIGQKIFAIRGGSWVRAPRLARTAFRGASYCDDTQDDIGFRVILYSID